MEDSYETKKDVGRGSKTASYVVDEDLQCRLAAMTFCPSVVEYEKEVAEKMYPLRADGRRTITRGFAAIRANAIAEKHGSRTAGHAVEKLQCNLAALTFAPSVIKYGKEVAEKMLPLKEDGRRTIARDYMEIRANAIANGQIYGRTKAESRLPVTPKPSKVDSPNPTYAEIVKMKLAGAQQ